MGEKKEKNLNNIIISYIWRIYCINIFCQRGIIIYLVSEEIYTVNENGNRGKCQATVLQELWWISQKDLSRDKLPRCVGIWLCDPRLGGGLGIRTRSYRRAWGRKFTDLECYNGRFRQASEWFYTNCCRDLGELSKV